MSVAKVCTKCKTAKPISEFYVDNRAKDGLRYYCIKCASQHGKEYRKTHKETINTYNKIHSEEIKAYKKEYHQTHRKKILAQKKEYHEAHSGKIKIYKKEYYQNNKPAYQKRCREYSNAHREKIDIYQKEYRENNRASANSRNAKRRAKKLNATPIYANKKLIERKYRIAQILSKMTGRKIQVDHIAPLQSPLVCGLHIETNLQILTQGANVRKGNRFEAGEMMVRNKQTKSIRYPIYNKIDCENCCETIGTTARR